MPRGRLHALRWGHPVDFVWHRKRINRSKISVLKFDAAAPPILGTPKEKSNLNRRVESPDFCYILWQHPSRKIHIESNRLAIAVLPSKRPIQSGPGARRLHTRRGERRSRVPTGEVRTCTVDLMFDNQECWNILRNMESPAALVQAGLLGATWQFCVWDSDAFSHQGFLDKLKDQENF